MKGFGEAFPREFERRLVFCKTAADSGGTYPAQFSAMPGVMPKCEAYPFFGNIFCEATWEHAFSGRYLSNILLFPGFLAIEDSAFKNNKLTSVTLPEGLISIGKDAFAHNDGISAITIPGTVTYVGAPLLKILLLGPTLRWGEGGIKVILAGSTTRTEKTAAVQQLYAMPPKLVGIFIIKNIKNGL